MEIIEKAIIRLIKKENIQGKDQLYLRLKEILIDLKINK